MSASCPEKSFTAEAWGPVAWHHLHLVGFAFPASPTEAEREDFARFIEYFTRTLPCSDCRKNFRRYIAQKFKPDTHLKNCETISKFLFNAHNDVNRKLGKPALPASKYDVVRRYFLSMRDPRIKATVNLVSAQSK